MESTGEVLRSLSRNKTAAEYIFERIRRDVVVGKIKPGQRLVERELTERFEMSRTPVREALQLLVRSQLALNIPYRGVEVRRLSYEFARDIYDLRRGIEGLAAYLAAERGSDTEIATIERLFGQISELSKDGQRDEVMVLNHKFHMAIAEATHNELLLARVDELWTSVNLVRASAWKGNERTEGSRREHEAILRALVERRAEDARQAVESHIRQSWRLVDGVMRANRTTGGSTPANKEEKKVSPEGSEREEA